MATIREITRSFLFSLEFASVDKKDFLQRLWSAYREMMQHFIGVGIAQNRIPDYQEVKTCPVGAFLSARYKGCALEQAKDILRSYFRLRKKHKNKELKKPEIKKISIRLDERFSEFGKSNNFFDFWLKLRDPETREWAEYPIKSYEYAKGIFWELRPFTEILRKDGKWYVKLSFKKTVELKEREPKGIDIGYRKLVATSDGEVYGEHVKQIIEKIDKKEQGSRKWRRKRHFLKAEINGVLGRVIGGAFSPVIEEFKDLKKGKWAKLVNRKFNHWIYSHVVKRIGGLCEVAGVQWHAVPPRNTSRTCPECGYQDKLNRNGDFKYLRCGYVEDADVVGAKNILVWFTEEFIVSLPAKPVFVENK